MFDEFFDRQATSRLPSIDIDDLKDVKTLDDKFIYFLNHGNSSESITDIFPEVDKDLDYHIEKGFFESDKESLLSLHKILFNFYELNWLNPLSPVLQLETHQDVLLSKKKIEDAFINYEISNATQDLPGKNILSSADDLVEWIGIYVEQLTKDDELLSSFFENDATLEQFHFFIKADAHLNYRFFDIISLSQCHFSETVKAELSHHFWDECGNGNPWEAHTVQYTKALKAIDVNSIPHVPIWNDWRPYAGFNLYFLLGFNRRHLFKSLGSLAMPELFDPKRDQAVLVGLNRLGFDTSSDFIFFHTHVEADLEHGDAWLNKVIKPIMLTNPDAGREFALGAIFRMNAMRRYNRFLLDKFALTL